MNRLVLCDGAKAPRSLRTFDPSPLPLNSMSQGAANIRVPSLSRALGTVAPGQAIDLLRIAAFAYWADQMTTRPVDVDVSGEQWTRNIAIVMPVYEPDLWRQPEVDRALRAALRYGTDHQWQFHFEALTGTDDVGFLMPTNTSHLGDPGSVLLFSGGTDSLCAAAQEASLGRRPILVSHSPSPRVKSRQDLVRDSLAAGLPGWHFPHFQIEVSKRGVSERERTQRTRGFLFSAVGASVAAGFGLQDVVLADNGFVSIALPLNGQTIGARMSRTTHPRFQYLFNQLCNLVLPGIELRNPLLNQTRAEALESLKLLRLEPAIQHTRSCSNAGRLPALEPQCGTCSQCLDRRIGVIASGLEPFDTRYPTDVFLDRLPDDKLMLVESYVRLMRKLAELSPDALLQEYVEIIDCAVEGPGSIESAVDLVRRQAETVFQVLEKVGAPELGQLFAGKLPNTCMVALAAAQSPVRRRKEWRAPVAPDFKLSDAEQRAFDSRRFKSSVPIIVTGEVSQRASNRIEVGGLRIELEDAEFILFLRLIVALHENWSDDGFCHKGGGRKPGGLAEEEGIVPAGVDQAIHRLRQRLQPCVGELDVKNVIEADGHGKIRLSTHPRLLEIRREALKDHKNAVVRSLLGRVPAFGFCRP